MPIFPDSDTIELATKLRALHLDGGPFSDKKPQAKQLIERYQHQYQGSGKESYVVLPNQEKVALPDWAKKIPPTFKKDFVIAIDHKKPLSPTEAKTLFYVQRILCTLFPNNFPRFYASYGSQDDRQPSGTIRERIYQTTEKYPHVKSPFVEVVRALKTANLPLVLETSPFNLTTSPDGHEYYNDRPANSSLITFSQNWTVERVRTFLDENNYPEKTQLIIFKLLNKVATFSKS